MATRLWQSLAPFLVLTFCPARAETLLNPHTDAGVAARVMTTQKARAEWDGSGELFLLPPEPSTEAAFQPTIFLKAAFDNSDVGQPDRPAVATTDRCPRVMARLRLGNGSMQLVNSYFGPSVRGSWGRTNGESGLTLRNSTCRVRLTLVTKIWSGDKWMAAPQRSVTPKPIVPKPPADSVRPPTGLPALRRGPAELSEIQFMMSIGYPLEPEFAVQCPKVTGTVLFDFEGISIETPWASNENTTPGLRRDAEHQSEVLIFQNDICRYEINVTRAIMVAGDWVSSDIAPPPDSKFPTP